MPPPLARRVGEHARAHELRELSRQLVADCRMRILGVRRLERAPQRSLQRQKLAQKLSQRIRLRDEPRAAALEARSKLSRRAHGRIELERLLRRRAEHVVDERRAVAHAVIREHEAAVCERSFADQRDLLR